jgi:hypothetical protein
VVFGVAEAVQPETPPVLPAPPLVLAAPVEPPLLPPCPPELPLLPPSVRPPSGVTAQVRFTQL